MVKKQPKPTAKPSIQWKPVLGKVGEIVKTALSSHPAVLGLSIMASTCIVSTVTSCASKDGWRREEIRAQMAGLYNGAQTVTLVMAAVPMITAVAGAVGSFAPKPQAATALPQPP